MMMRPYKILGFGLLLTLTLAACGGGDSSSSEAPKGDGMTCESVAAHMAQLMEKKVEASMEAAKQKAKRFAGGEISALERARIGRGYEVAHEMHRSFVSRCKEGGRLEKLEPLFRCYSQLEELKGGEACDQKFPDLAGQWIAALKTVKAEKK